jgi:carbonic anhydrase/acetyltransferase-like protein (isoleucine patch superfamily)
MSAIPLITQRLLSRLAYIAPGGDSVRPWLHRLRGVNIGKNVWISQLVYIDELHPELVSIGDNTTIGLRTSIVTHLYWGGRKEDNGSHVVIENDVYVGPHCLILPNVRIGQGSVIKGGSVITRNVPPFSFWGFPSGEILGHVTVPLTREHSYEEFVKGLRPHRGPRPNGGNGKHKTVMSREKDPHD